MTNKFENYFQIWLQQTNERGHFFLWNKKDATPSTEL